MEHREAVLESLQTDFPPHQVLLGTELYEQDATYWESMVRRISTTQWFLLESEELDRLLSVKGSNGLCGVFRPFDWKLDDVLRSGVVLVTWQIQDPGNLGTLIRSVAGLAGGGLVCIGGCRPWSSKVARSSAGALLRIPVVQVPLEEGGELLEALKSSGFSLFAAVPKGGEPAREVSWTGRDAILVGNESHGLPQQVVDGSLAVTLPMTSDTESLNAGVAASILIYERTLGSSEP